MRADSCRPRLEEQHRSLITMSKLEDTSDTKATIGQAKNEEGYTHADFMKMAVESSRPEKISVECEALVDKSENTKVEQRQYIKSSSRFKDFITSQSSGILSFNGNSNSDSCDTILALGYDIWTYTKYETRAYGVFHRYQQQMDENKNETSMLLGNLVEKMQAFLLYDRCWDHRELSRKIICEEDNCTQRRFRDIGDYIQAIIEIRKDIPACFPTHQQYLRVKDTNRRCETAHWTRPIIYHQW